MLKAEKSRWFEKLFALYNRNLFKRRFHSINIANLEVFQIRETDCPLVIYANHSSWWDGLVAFEVSRLAKLDSFIMMNENQLRRFFLFRRLGAFSVIRDKPREAVKSLDYAAKILTENACRTLWIFPQGEILSNDIRPLRFFGGLARIIQKLDKTYILPLAMRYEFVDDFKPEVFVQIGELKLLNKEKTDRKKIIKDLEVNLTEILDQLKIDIQDKNFSKFKKI